MTKQKKFASPEIAKEVGKVFGADTRTLSVKFKHKKAVGDFVRKIEKAHKNTVKSRLVFDCQV